MQGATVPFISPWPTKLLMFGENAQSDQLHVPANHFLSLWISQASYSMSRTCAAIWYLFTWRLARLPQSNTSFFIGLFSSLKTIWTFSTRFRSGLDFRNYILLIAYYLLEIHLPSILFDCTLWDSVPDGSLQWSSSVLVSVWVSMVAPTWCNGPIWGNPSGRMLTNGPLNLHILIW